MPFSLLKTIKLDSWNTTAFGSKTKILQVTDKITCSFVVRLMRVLCCWARCAAYARWQSSSKISFFEKEFAKSSLLKIQCWNSRNPLDIKPDANRHNCTWRNSSPFSLARSRRNNRSGIAAAFADRWPSPMMNQMKPRRLFINNRRSVGTARRPGQAVQLQATASVLAPIIYRHATNRIWLAYNHTFICAYSLSI